MSTNKGILTFLGNENLVNFCVGVAIANAFAALVSAIVRELLFPCISVAARRRIDSGFVVIMAGKSGERKYTSADTARADEAVVIGYGRLLQTCVELVFMAVVTFLVIRVLSRAKGVPRLASSTIEKLRTRVR